MNFTKDQKNQWAHRLIDEILLEEIAEDLGLRWTFSSRPEGVYIASVNGAVIPGGQLFVVGGIEQARRLMRCLRADG